jgi:hypothetical protein
MALDFPNRHAPGVERQDFVVKARPAGLVLRNQLRLEGAVAVAGYLYRQFAKVALPRASAALLPLVFLPMPAFSPCRIPRGMAQSGSSALARRQGLKGNSMKKAKAANEPDDEMRAEYRREDFGAMARGKYAKACREASNVVVIAPEVQKAFPNAQAVNDALRGLLELARRAPRARRKTAAG